MEELEEALKVMHARSDGGCGSVGPNHPASPWRCLPPKEGRCGGREQVAAPLDAAVGAPPGGIAPDVVMPAALRWPCTLARFWRKPWVELEPAVAAVLIAVWASR